MGWESRTRIDQIDLESFLHEGVLCFDHHAAGHKTVRPRQSLAHRKVRNFSDDRAFIQYLSTRRHASSHYRNSKPNWPVQHTLGPVLQKMDLAVPELQCSGPSINKLARIGISGSVENTSTRREQDETDHMIHVQLRVENVRNSSKGFRRKTHEHVSAVEPRIAQNTGCHLPKSCAPQTSRGKAASTQ